MSCTYFTPLCRTLSFTAISTLVTLVPVAAGALEPEDPRDIVITLDKNPLVALEAACTAVTAARVLKTYQYTDDTGDHVVHNNVTLLPVLDGVNLARAAVLNDLSLYWHKCKVPGSFVDSSEEIVQVTLKENLEGFLQCDIDIGSCRGDNDNLGNPQGTAHLYPCFICWQTRFGHTPADAGEVNAVKEVPALLGADQILRF